MGTLGVYIMLKWIIIVVLSFAVAAFIFLGREMVLVPEESVRVVDSLESLNIADPAKTIAWLEPNQPVKIVECLNLIDDQVYRVKTPSGIEGYVADGRFAIQRKSFWESISGKRVICH